MIRQNLQPPGLGSLVRSEGLSKFENLVFTFSFLSEMWSMHYDISRVRGIKLCISKEESMQMKEYKLGVKRSSSIIAIQTSRSASWHLCEDRERYTLRRISSEKHVYGRGESGKSSSATNHGSWA
jgi:hypothetical protein